PSTALLPHVAMPFIGEKPLHRDEEEGAKPPLLRQHDPKPVLGKQSREKFLRQILRIMWRTSRPAHVSVERIPVSATKRLQRRRRIRRRLVLRREHHRPASGHEERLRGVL